MKKRMIMGFIISLLLAACGGIEEAVPVEALILSVDGEEIRFTVEDLEEMDTAEAEFQGTVYVGVPLVELLRGFDVDLAQVENVKAIAADGYSVSYGPELFTREDVLVAYAQAEGELSSEDGTFRMVLPGEEGKLNLRMLSELQVEMP